MSMYQDDDILIDDYYSDDYKIQYAMRPEIHVSGDDVEMVTQLKNYLTKRLKYLLDMPGTIAIGVSGGSMPPIFTKALFACDADLLNWKRIRIFMVDERYVDKDDEQSNLGTYLKLFPPELAYVFVPIPICNDLSLTARLYEDNLRRILLPEQSGTSPRFDLLFLGCGPDGHTASLFPGDRAEHVTEYGWVGVVQDSPKPPKARITLSFASLKFAKHSAFIISGAPKAHVVRAIWDRDNTLPASMARPYNDRLTLFVDEAAAKSLPSRDSSEESDSRSPPPFD
ncbi:unnamed protein product [Caenorhabditis nigoni]